MTFSSPKQILVAIIISFVIILTGCSADLLSHPTLTPSLIPSPSDTPIPLAVIVNGEGITVADFEAELSRYQQAQVGLGNTVTLETATQTVLNDMVDTLLLEQGAVAQGFTVDEATVQSRIDALAAKVGGLDALAAWESSHGYTDAAFRSALRRQIAAAWMRDQIASTVSPTAEQVHGKQILRYNESEAQQALGYLQAGWNFEDLAAQYDQVTKGELGWFPRGYLPSKAIEDAAFALQPGQYSAIIQDDTGYHILFVVERDPTRLLSPDALLTLQEHALQGWLIQKQNESTIIYTP